MDLCPRPAIFTPELPLLDSQASRRYRQGTVSKCDGHPGLCTSLRDYVFKRARTAELTLNTSPATAECDGAFRYINVLLNTHGLLALFVCNLNREMHRLTDQYWMRQRSGDFHLESQASIVQAPSSLVSSVGFRTEDTFG
jgi:hypothetical protein